MRERPGFGLATMWRWTGGPVACPLLGKATAACFLAGIGMVLWMPALPFPWLRWAALVRIWRSVRRSDIATSDDPQLVKAGV